MSFSLVTLLTFLVACWCSGCQGQMMSMAPMGSNLMLSCPRGQEINIVSMVHSNKGFENNAQDFCSSIAPPSCLHPMLMPWSKSICDNLQECRLPKVKKMALTCDVDSSTAISAFYICENKFPDKCTVIACKDQTANLKCENGVIRIIKSNYGRLDQNTCTDTPSENSFCGTKDFEEDVKRMCNGRKECSIPGTAEDQIFYRFCDESPKYVYVSYVCEA
ncbi:L-rhamnose-binding lectin CSL1-like [Takifugu flavidus]|uniref:L-rhamnose-binding lectin CSL1-like n=1 Tax=Takifugu flavidus TaxID=433684 RepID=UPI00254486ED|nr:L-rhamnose-binding lectin CSL1-like [Takifugu flavidus]